MLEFNEANKIISEAECLYSSAEVAQALDAISKPIYKKYFDKNPLVLCVMNGGAFTACALMQRLQFPLEFDFVQVSRYRNSTSGGEIEWLVKPKTEIAGRHVLVVDDIFDEGITLQAIIDHCEAEQATSVEVAVLTYKNHKRKNVSIMADYVALEIPDRYVFGCGMDYQGYFRNINGIYAITETE